MTSDTTPGCYPAALYTAMHGTNEYANQLLEWLGINQPDTDWEVGRYRDAWLTREGTIVVLTRNGGPFRGRFAAIMKELSTHPCWLRDWDDEFDESYALIEFEVPAEFRADAVLMAPKEPVPSLREKALMVFPDRSAT